MTKMFPFINKTWNPLTGSCQYKCSYCWARRFANRRKMAKYIQASVWVDLVAMQKKFTEKDFIFVQDMSDLFGSWVDSKWIQQVLDYIAKSPAQFLLLTKNPARYHEFSLPDNCVAGATIESDIDFEVSKAPKPEDRINAMIGLAHNRKMISIEPIMEFNCDTLYNAINEIDPEIIAIGYDNYQNGLDEPTMGKTLEFIDELEKDGREVYQKTIREPIVASYGKRGELC